MAGRKSRSMAHLIRTSSRCVPETLLYDNCAAAADLITDNQISDLCANKEAYSVKTIVEYDKLCYRFEGAVVLEGSQPKYYFFACNLRFERSVVLKGSQPC